MHIDAYMVLGSAIVGLLVGMTGAGGGALMTPMLVFVFGVTPSAAISSDLVAAVVMRPVGAAVHLRRRTANLALVRWLATGSVPGALFGAFLFHLLGSGTAATHRLELVLGAALLAGAGAMVARQLFGRRSAADQDRVAGGDGAGRLTVRPALTVAIGAVGGVMVGLTSVGSGSLMIVLLLCCYPALTASRLVGTDLVQAIPLTLAGALGQLLFGHVELAVAASVVIGSVPAVLVGSLLSSRAPDRFIRPVVVAVVFASGLKYVGASPTVLVLGVVAVLVAVVAGPRLVHLAHRRPTRAVGSDDAQLVSVGGHSPHRSPPAGRPSPSEVSG